MKIIQFASRPLKIEVGETFSKVCRKDFWEKFKEGDIFKFRGMIIKIIYKELRSSEMDCDDLVALQFLRLPNETKLDKIVYL